MARAFLSNPRWVWDAADILGAEIETPNQLMQDVLKNLFNVFRLWCSCCKTSIYDNFRTSNILGLIRT